MNQPPYPTAQPKKSTVIDWSKVLGDRQPPHNIEMEQALLASIILEGGSESIPTCTQHAITSHSFYKPSHQLIYDALIRLYERGVTPIDEVLLIDQLTRDGTLEQAGGDAYLIELTNRIDTPIGLSHYVERVSDAAQRREILRASNVFISMVFDGIETPEIKAEVQNFAIGNDSPESSSTLSTSSLTQDVISEIRNPSKRQSGLKTGIPRLDGLTGGLRPGQMVVIGARPGMGKTSLALNISEAVSTTPGTGDTLFFSLEMSSRELVSRLIHGRAGVSPSRAREGLLTLDDHSSLEQAATDINAARLKIIDQPTITIAGISSRVRRHTIKHGSPSLVVIDYLQLITPSNPRLIREQQIAEISRGIKLLTKEAGCPIILLAQLSRALEADGRQPRPSDLRESGSIEQDADIVLLISPPRYDPDSRAPYSLADEDPSAPCVPRHILLAKQRNGPTGFVPVDFHRSICRFTAK